MTELLVGTKKGLFVLRGADDQPFEIGTRAFPGDVVEFARARSTHRQVLRVGDVRVLRTPAAVHGRRHRGVDTGEGTGVPRGPARRHVERIWIVKPGEADGVLYAGVAPAALFVSTDSGETWELNRALWNVPTRRASGTLAPAGSPCTRSARGPGTPTGSPSASRRQACGSRRTAAQTWRTGYTGLVPGYVPEDERDGTNTLCVHNMHRAPLRPERLFMQFHGSVYRPTTPGSPGATSPTGCRPGSGSLW